MDRSYEQLLSPLPLLLVLVASYSLVLMLARVALEQAFFDETGKVHKATVLSNLQLIFGLQSALLLKELYPFSMLQLYFLMLLWTLKYCGGSISSEMKPPKLLWVKDNLQESWSMIFRWMDLRDWLAYMATGDDNRSMCTTVCKWTYLGHAHMQLLVQQSISTQVHDIF
ncbi:hypothetical protein L6452_02029 [Arctium lappa]|uniref:Uncharacterized protein n=1 Tax=Arctium lappa TaxID=4217 RepID=A0ACB9FJ66_ARCLA|nr:hypothetical protein L6452_02029 [Arctium lappa]